jgi:hypothetical protein
VASEGENAEFAAASRSPGSGSSIQALVNGNFSYLGNDAEVSLSLISTAGDRTVLGSSKFVIPAEELSKRNLSLLPPKDTALITQKEYEAKQTAVSLYDDKNNAFTFTVSLDHLDGIYYDGEYMTLSVYAERDCYFKITQVDVNGKTQVIYPTAARDNNFIKGGEARRIPDNTRFRMNRPFGEEFILVAAYSKPVNAAANNEAQISDAVISQGLFIENNQPLAAAKISYTILPKR